MCPAARICAHFLGKPAPVCVMVGVVWVRLVVTCLIASIVVRAVFDHDLSLGRSLLARLIAGTGAWALWLAVERFKAHR